MSRCRRRAGRIRPAGAAFALLGLLPAAACTVRISTGEDVSSVQPTPSEGAAMESASPSFDRSIPPEVRGRPRIRIAPVETFALGNGLQVVVLQRQEVPLVSMVLQFPGGSAGVHPSRAGLPALAAEMLEEGTEERSGFEVADALERLGASFSSSTGPDASDLTLEVVSSRLDPALEIFAEVLLRPAFPEEGLERIRAQRLNRILQGREDPRVLADDAFARLLYGEDHPYGQPAIGTEATLASLSVEDVRGYYDSAYNPARATLVVAGDVDPEELAGRLEGLLGADAWSPRDFVDPGVEAPPAESGGPRIFIVDKPGAAQTEIRVGRVAVGAGFVEDDQYPALEVLNTLLGGSFTSRLNTRIREEKGYSYGARSSFQLLRHPGPFTASSAVYTPVTDSAVVEFVREIRRLSEEQVPEEELAQARNYVALRFPQGFETAGDLAGRMAEARLYGYPEDFFDRYVDRVSEVTARDVQEAARRWLDPDRMIIVLAGDREAIEDPVRALGLGPVTVIEPGDAPGRTGSGR